MSKMQNFSNEECANVVARENIECRQEGHPAVINMLDRQVRKDNGECPNELTGLRKESALLPKNGSHYLNDKEWPLLGSQGAIRRGGLVNDEPTSPGASCETSNNQ